MADSANDSAPSESSDTDAAVTQADDLDIACSLSDDEIVDRRQWVTSNLFPHLIDIVDQPDGVTLVFERGDTAFEAVAGTLWKEAQCCSFTTFELEVPPGDAPLKWHQRSEDNPEASQFGDSVKRLLAASEHGLPGDEPDIAD